MLIIINTKNTKDKTLIFTDLPWRSMVIPNAVARVANDITRNSTLNILSKFLGFNDWDGFLEFISNDSGSAIIGAQHIKTDDLTAGDHIMVSWKPNRRCTFRYLGDGRFIVEKSENSKLKVGNTFSCGIFIIGEPLYLNDLVQGDNAPVAFVVGNKDGLVELHRE